MKRKKQQLIISY